MLDYSRSKITIPKIILALDQVLCFSPSSSFSAHPHPFPLPSTQSHTSFFFPFPSFSSFFSLYHPTSLLFCFRLFLLYSPQLPSLPSSPSFSFRYTYVILSDVVSTLEQNGTLICREEINQRVRRGFDNDFNLVSRLGFLLAKLNCHLKYRELMKEGAVFQFSS